VNPLQRLTSGATLVESLTVRLTTEVIPDSGIRPWPAQPTTALASVSVGAAAAGSEDWPRTCNPGDRNLSPCLLQQIRAAVQHLSDRGIANLAQVTLMSDGISVYEYTSADQVVDLLQGGQGIFGIALGRVWREVEADLAALPAVRAEDDVVSPVALKHG
jgi:hypothetical protein